MQVFVAFSLSDREKVREILEQKYKDEYYDDGNNFFVATEGETTRQFGSNIGIGGDDSVSSGIVLPVTSYWGRYKQEVWEWIDVKQSA